MSIPGRCLYCQRVMPSVDMMLHFDECHIRALVFEAELTLGRVLTDEEIEDIRDRAAD